MHSRNRSKRSLWMPASLSLLAALVVTTSCRSPGDEADEPQSEGALLYAENCAACHGDSGRGDGPAARAVRVRPRDFWNEPFRYVSSLNGAPTRTDVYQTIRNGRLIGEMPSHPSLSDRQVELITDYVIEINRRGWIERLTVEFADDDELEPEDIDEIATDKVTPRDAIRVPALPRNFRFDTDVAHKLYVAQCASCHGETGSGDGLDLPKDSQGRPIEVRDLTVGDYRGGTSPQELFKRIRCGIPGTPMPAQVQMDDEQVWQLTYYSLFLAGKYTSRR